MSEAHRQQRPLSDRNRQRQRPRELILYTIIVLLLAVQLNSSSSRHNAAIANKHSHHGISKVEGGITDQPTDEDTKNSSLRSGHHGEVEDERKTNQKPHVVAIVDKNGGMVLPLTNVITPYNLTKVSEQDMPDDLPLINSTWYEPNAAQYQKDIYDLQTCQPMHDWQLKSYSNCNSFHELELTKIRYITSGEHDDQPLR